MLAYYGTKISEHMTDTPEGYLVCRDVPIARTGDMTYRAGELELEGDPDRLVTVRREEADVFSPAAIASFEGKDVTAGHPAEMVGPENHAAYTKGHVQNVRREGELLVADLLIKDAALISDIRNNIVREVSCGYHCQYVPDGSGYRQAHIRGNHVAVVSRGRAGRAVAIKDSAENAGKGTDMSKFSEAILKAFGMAAHEAEDPAAVEALIPTAATALDAEPAGKAPEAVPAAAVPASNAALNSLNEKMDRLISLMEAKDSTPPKEDEPDGGKALDDLLENLEGKQAATISDDEDGGEKKEPEPLSEEAKDAALAILKSVRPAVAAIEDKAARARVTDALLNAVRGGDALGAITKAAGRNAQKAADAASQSSYEKICADQKAAYDARNPHKKQEA